jgi:hypothetical protein
VHADTRVGLPSGTGTPTERPPGGAVDPDAWLGIVEREYLADFVPAGGAVVKFVVPPTEPDREALREALRGAAERRGFAFAVVDAASTKLHMIDRLFHAVARQIDWDGLIRSFLTGVLSQNELRLPPSPSGLETAPSGPGAAWAAAPDELRLSVIAGLNDVPEPLLRTHVDRWIWDAVFRDYAMSQEFRYALIHLCLDQLDPGIDPALGAAIREWLLGEIRLLSGLKRALIFQKIARHNARHILFSLTHWLERAGKKGLVLVLDISRYTVTRRPIEPDGTLYYSTAAVLDAYELLRQLIDATDELEHCFVCAVAAPEFLSDERRGMTSYHALNLRIADEVRDRYRPNPLAALARLTG